MTSDYVNDDPEGPDGSGKGRRDFARAALAACGALLIGPTVMAAAPRRISSAAATFSRYIYFYYLTPGPDDHPRVRAYFIEDQDPVQNIATRAIDLVRDAKSGKLTPLGQRMGALLWCRKSYIVVVLDHPKDKLRPGQAMAFKPIPSQTAGHLLSNDASHTFKSRKDIPLSGKLTGWYCENHLKKSDQTDLKRDEAEYFEVEVKTLLHPIRGHFDTGTNTGPPP